MDLYDFNSIEDIEDYYNGFVYDDETKDIETRVLKWDGKNFEEFVANLSEQNIIEAFMGLEDLQYGDVQWCFEFDDLSERNYCIVSRFIKDWLVDRIRNDNEICFTPHIPNLFQKYWSIMTGA